jgi:hypothetical protein
VFRQRCQAELQRLTVGFAPSSLIQAVDKRINGGRLLVQGGPFLFNRHDGRTQCSPFTLGSLGCDQGLSFLSLKVGRVLIVVDRNVFSVGGGERATAHRTRSLAGSQQRTILLERCLFAADLFDGCASCAQTINDRLFAPATCRLLFRQGLRLDLRHCSGTQGGTPGCAITDLLIETVTALLPPIPFPGDRMAMVCKRGVQHLMPHHRRTDGRWLLFERRMLHLTVPYLLCCWGWFSLVAAYR